jgi:copper chaperone CopZ
MMQTERLEVTGMSCGGCVHKVTGALEAVRGVNGVDVSLEDHEATVSFDMQLTSLSQLESAVRDAGYGLGASGVKPAAQTKGCCCG